MATDAITGNTAWSNKYVYNDNGNITSTTNARNVSVTATYDKFNRITLRNYDDTTPDVDFYYDGRGLGTIPNFSKGKTTKVSSSVSETRYTSFDNLGRLETHQQITDGNTYNTSYQYDNFGTLISETYPSGRTVKTDYNQDGEVSRIWGTVGTNNRVYANAIYYNSQGGMERLRLGNGKWETAKFNDRQQITEIGLGTSATDKSLLKLEYGYGTNTQNNGSLRSQKISFNGLTQPFEQTYTYDDLNRLSSAEEKVNNQTNWKETFQYDRYGNRRFDAANTTTLPANNNITNPTISTANNRFSTGQNYVYDQTGNVTNDAEGFQYLYDGENHQKEVKNASNQTVGTYLYDGDGKRVKKITNTETTVFVYNGAGQLVAEYSNQTVQNPQISYLTSDHLGSPRVITNSTGGIIARKDFNAFGDETLTAQRTETLGYKPENIRQDYTGYQKDDESGLEFAQARYYNSGHGRFTSVDPLTASANVKDPQTFNRYSYAMNSPYKFTDPLGLLASSTGVNYGEGCSAEFTSCEDGTRDPVEEPEHTAGDVEGSDTTTSNNQEEAGGQNAEEAEPPPSDLPRGIINHLQNDAEFFFYRGVNERRISNEAMEQVVDNSEELDDWNDSLVYRSSELEFTFHGIGTTYCIIYGNSCGTSDIVLIDLIHGEKDQYVDMIIFRFDKTSELNRYTAETTEIFKKTRDRFVYQNMKNPFFNKFKNSRSFIKKYGNVETYLTILYNNVISDSRLGGNVSVPDRLSSSPNGGSSRQ